MCRLRAVHELFKEPREELKAVVSAQRFLGESAFVSPDDRQPMLEYHFCKTYPHKRPHPQLRPAAWRQHTIVHGPHADFYKPGRKQGGRGRKGFRGGAMFWDVHAWDLLYNVDGFTVYEKKDKKSFSNIVFVSEDDCLPVYTHPDVGASESDANMSKQHYFVLTGASGVVAVAALASGTKLHKSREKGKFDFWWDQMAQLLTKHDLGGEDPEELRTKFAGTTWEVLTFTHACPTLLCTALI